MTTKEGLELRVVINKIARDDAELKVSFSTVFGSAEAFWDGVEPRVGGKYDVELEIDRTLHWGINIDRSPIEVSSIAFDDDTGIIIVGQLESLDDDGFGVIRLGDFIITFLVDGDMVGKNIGLFVEISSVNVKLYQYDL